MAGGLQNRALVGGALRGYFVPMIRPREINLYLNP